MQKIDKYKDSVPYFYFKLETLFCYFMQIQQLFIVLRQPVANLVSVFSNPTKLTNDLYMRAPTVNCVETLWKARVIAVTNLNSIPHSLNCVESLPCRDSNPRLASHLSEKQMAFQWTTEILVEAGLYRQLKNVLNQTKGVMSV